MNSLGEYGRAVRFSWSPLQVAMQNGNATIYIGEFTNSKERYYLKLSHLRNALRVIDGKKPIPPFDEVPSNDLEFLKKRVV